MIENKKTEERYYTSDPSRMVGKYITQRVYRTYIQELIDKDSGKVESIERHEILFDRGILITPDVLEEIKFWINEGSIKGIEVSNQKRLSFTQENTYMFPYRTMAKIDGKKHSFLLYALSVQNVIEIITDFIELNYSGGFTITDIKELDYCVVLVDKLKSIKQRNLELDIAYLNDEITMEEYMDSKIDNKSENENANIEDDSDDLKLKFYQIGAKIISRIDENDTNEEEYSQTFIVQTFSAVRANLIIEKFLQDQQEKLYIESLSHPDKNFIKKQIMSFIEESKIISIGRFIPKIFSEAYNVE